MTCAATIFERFMQNISDKTGPLTAVRAMTGKTILEFARKILMPIFQFGTFMTGQAQPVTPIGKQLEVIRLVRSMTGHAVSLCIRFMGHPILLG